MNLKKWFGGNKKEKNVVLQDQPKNLPQKVREDGLTTIDMISSLTDDKLANCINHPNLQSDNPKKYFVVKDTNAYYKTLMWDDGNNLLINEFTLSLQWKLEDRVK